MSEQPTIDEDQKKKIEDATNAALKSIVDKKKEDDIAKAKAEAKEEAKREFELQETIRKQEEAMKKLLAEQEAAKKANEEHLAEIQKKLEEVQSQSRAPVNMQDPFKNESMADKILKGLTPQKMAEIEDNSMREFFDDAQIINRILRERGQNG